MTADVGRINDSRDDALAVKRRSQRSVNRSMKMKKKLIFQRLITDRVTNASFL